MNDFRNGGRPAFRCGVARRAPSDRLAGFVLSAITLGSLLLQSHLSAPPRHDGAGYAMLGWSVRTGYGYQDLSHPERPPHTHFPPLYPLILACFFACVGRSAGATHLLSILFTLIATLAFWRWLRGRYSRAVAFLLGSALAVNWSWARTGSAILSEPLFEMLTMLVLLTASRRGTLRFRQQLGVGVLLGAATLTRHVGVCLILAVLVHLLLARRRSEAGVIGLSALALITIWVGWLWWVGSRSQANLLDPVGLTGRLWGQTLFYIRRIPDQILGPFVEVATVYVARPWVARVATVGAAIASSVVFVGWWNLLRSPRRRLAALIPVVTLSLLLVWPFTEAGRFLVPLIPFILLGAWEATARCLRAIGFRQASVCAGALVILISLPYPSYAILTRRAQAHHATYRDFDAACSWIKGQTDRPGPVMAVYPADVYWQTGRQVIGTPEGATRLITRDIDKYQVTYLLVDENPFSNAPSDPIARFVRQHSEELNRVWGPHGAVSVFEVLSPLQGSDHQGEGLIRRDGGR